MVSKSNVGTQLSTHLFDTQLMQYVFRWRSHSRPCRLFKYAWSSSINCQKCRSLREHRERYTKIFFFFWGKDIKNRSLTDRSTFSRRHERGLPTWFWATLVILAKQTERRVITLISFPNVLKRTQQLTDTDNYIHKRSYGHSPLLRLISPKSRVWKEGKKQLVIKDWNGNRWRETWVKKKRN